MRTVSPFGSTTRATLEGSITPTWNAKEKPRPLRECSRGSPSDPGTVLPGSSQGRRSSNHRLRARTPRAVSRAIQEPRRFLRPVEPAQGAAEVSDRGVIGRIGVDGAHEESPGNVVIPAREHDETHLAQGDVIARLETQCVVQLAPCRFQVAVLAREAGKKYVRRGDAIVFPRCRRELAARGFPLSPLHIVYARGYVRFGAARPREDEIPAGNQQQQQDRETYPCPERSTIPSRPRRR